MVCWLAFRVVTAMVWVQSLAGELRSHKQSGWTKKKKKSEKEKKKKREYAERIVKRSWENKAMRRVWAVYSGLAIFAGRG